MYTNTQDLNLDLAASAVEELQSVISDEAAEIQHLLTDLGHMAGRLELPASGDVPEQAVDDLRWTAASLRNELQDAQQIIRAAADRLLEARELLR